MWIAGNQEERADPSTHGATRVAVRAQLFYQEAALGAPWVGAPTDLKLVVEVDGGTLQVSALLEMPAFIDVNGSTGSGPIQVLGQVGLSVGVHTFPFVITPRVAMYWPIRAFITTSFASFEVEVTLPVDAPLPNPIAMPRVGEIAFVRASGPGPITQIRKIRSDGSSDQVLVDEAQVEATPRFSPNGSQIAFVSRRVNFSAQVYVMDAGGGNQHFVTASPSPPWPAMEAASPHWSPDGAHLLFTSHQVGGHWQIWEHQLTGGGSGVVIEQPGVEVVDAGYMRLDRWVALFKGNATRPDHLVMGAKPFNGTRQFDYGLSDLYQRSSISTHLQHDLIVYEGLVSGGTPDDAGIFVWDPRLGETFLTHGREPAFSPDGYWIVFARSAAYGEGLWIMDVRGQQLRQLTYGPDRAPDWTALRKKKSPRPPLRPGTSSAI